MALLFFKKNVLSSILVEMIRTLRRSLIPWLTNKPNLKH